MSNENLAPVKDLDVAKEAVSEAPAQQPQVEAFTVPADLMDGIIAYLIRQPFDQVDGIISACRTRVIPVFKGQKNS